jgi:hypothetical protein
MPLNPDSREFIELFLSEGVDFPVLGVVARGRPQSMSDMETFDEETSSLLPPVTRMIIELIERLSHEAAKRGMDFAALIRRHGGEEGLERIRQMCQN